MAAPGTPERHGLLESGNFDGELDSGPSMEGKPQPRAARGLQRAALLSVASIALVAGGLIARATIIKPEVAEGPWDLVSSPSCPSKGDGVRLTATTPGPMLERVLRAAGGHPNILILSCGTRLQGAKTGRLMQEWARSTHNRYRFANYAAKDHKPVISVDPKVVIRNFLRNTARQGKGSVIMYTGHGSRRNGQWICKNHKFKALITPSWMRQLATQVGGQQPIIVTGACFGGKWLHYFKGISGTKPNTKNSAAFYNWMFKGGKFPHENGKYPMCKGV